MTTSDRRSTLAAAVCSRCTVYCTDSQITATGRKTLIDVLPTPSDCLLTRFAALGLSVRRGTGVWHLSEPVCGSDSDFPRSFWEQVLFFFIASSLLHFPLHHSCSSCLAPSPFSRLQDGHPGSRWSASLVRVSWRSPSVLYVPAASWPKPPLQRPTHPPFSSTRSSRPALRP